MAAGRRDRPRGHPRKCVCATEPFRRLSGAIVRFAWVAVTKRPSIGFPLEVLFGIALKNERSGAKCPVGTFGSCTLLTDSVLARHAIVRINAGCTDPDFTIEVDADGSVFSERPIVGAAHVEPALCSCGSIGNGEIRTHEFRKAELSHRPDGAHCPHGA